MGTTYTVSVVSENDFARSKESDPITIVYYSQPSAPVAFEEIERTDTNAVYVWQMPEELGGDKSVTFNIELRQIIKGRKYTIDSEEGWTELTYTAKGLQGGRLYSI